MRIENRGSCRPTIADSASVVDVGSLWPRMGATSPPRVTIGLPMEPHATGAGFGGKARTAALIGSKPRLARNDPAPPTGAPKTAEPAHGAPQPDDTRRALRRQPPA